MPRTASPPIPAPAYGAAAIAAGAILALYVATLGPTTALWDTSEYITVAHVLGLPHPPGNPLFVLIARVFALLPIGPSVAMRVNLLAALTSALAAGLWFLVAERVLSRVVQGRWQRLVGAGAAALLGATTFTVWSQSVVNEKVYTVSLLGLALVSWLTLRWLDDPDSPRADRLLVLVAYLLGLGYANHMAGLLAAPAVAVAVLVRRPAFLLRKRLIVACFGAMALGVTPFAMEPIRAAHFPPINEGEPTACTNGLELSCTFSELTAKRLADNINRVQYGKPTLLDRQAPFSAQVGMWALYFRWQWMRDARAEHPMLQSILAAAFLALGLLGGLAHWRFDRRTFWYAAPLMGTVTIALIYYMNFKYGWSQSPELEFVQREVRDRDYFFIWSFSLWGVWAALGLVWLWRGAADAMAGTLPEPRRRWSWALAAPVLAIALVPLAANWSSASRRGDTIVRDYAHDLLATVEPYGVLFTGGDNDTFPLWYAQEVEGYRRDVTILVTSYLGTDWYVRQLIRRPLERYDSARGPAIYGNREWTPPTRPVLSLTVEQADAVPPVIRMSEPSVFRVNDLIAAVPAGILTRDQLIVLQAIKDSSGERPIYFSRGTGNYPFTLGLGPYLVTQGLARKLEPRSPDGRPGIVLSPRDGYIDVPRTRELFDTVYRAPDAMRKRGWWVDRASLSIPFTYIDSAARLAMALDEMGRPADAERYMRRALDLAREVGVGTASEAPPPETLNVPSDGP